MSEPDRPKSPDPMAPAPAPPAAPASSAAPALTPAVTPARRVVAFPASDFTSAAAEPYPDAPPAAPRAAEHLADRVDHAGKDKEDSDG